MDSAPFINRITTKWIIWLTVISVTWVNFNQERWLGKIVLNHDVGQYYSYLPALFYKHDLKLSFVGDSAHRTVEGYHYAPRFTEDGRPVIKMSMGMAVSYLPFFAMAYIFVQCSEKTWDAFSEPYQFAILFSSLFYYVIGLFFLGKILNRFFNQAIVSLTLFCVTFGTNTFYYLTIGAGMSHTVGFAFIAIFIYYTIKWYEEQKLVYALILGLSCGYLVLVRPTNLLVAIFFLLYQIKNAKDIKDRWQLYSRHYFQLILIAVAGFLVFFPQMLYWHYATGHYLYNSYVGEHFFFNNPHISKAIFGFRKGWLIYTPIMAFSISGMFILYKQKRDVFWASTVLFVIYIYVAFSWWCWWYGGTFGQRVLIDIYPMLAIPFAAQLYFIQQNSKTIRTTFYALLTFFVMLNLFQTMQAKYNILHYDSMTRENYKEIFFTITTKPDRDKYLQKPDYKRALQGLEED